MINSRIKKKYLCKFKLYLKQIDKIILAKIDPKILRGIE